MSCLHDLTVTFILRSFQTMPQTKAATVRKAALYLQVASSHQPPVTTPVSGIGRRDDPATGSEQAVAGASTPQFGSWSVRADSLTPYTDATSCQHSKRRATGVGRSSSGVRRPMNAFMVWSQIERRRVSAVDPTLHNAEISRRLGARWRRLSAAERRPYVEEADRLRVLHSVEFPDYKYTPRKSRKTRPASARRQRATTNHRKSAADDVTQFPADAYDSEVSRYFTAGGATSAGRRSGRRSSKRRAVRRQTAPGGSGPGGVGRYLPPTPDSSAQYRAERQLFRAIGGDVPRAAAAATASSKRSSRSRFEFPTVTSPSDVRLGGFWTDAVTAGGGDDDSDDAGALDTPISLELDASTARSLFDDRHNPPSFGDSTTSAGDGCSAFCVDYCTPEVAAIVRDDWLEETIHNDALI